MGEVGQVGQVVEAWEICGDCNHLEAFLILKGALGAQAVEVPATMLGSNRPADLRDPTGLPHGGGRAGSEDLGALGPRGVPLGRLCIRGWMDVARRRAA